MIWTWLPVRLPLIVANTEPSEPSATPSIEPVPDEMTKFWAAAPPLEQQLQVPLRFGEPACAGIAMTAATDAANARIHQTRCINPSPRLPSCQSGLTSSPNQAI